MTQAHTLTCIPAILQPSECIKKKVKRCTGLFFFCSLMLPLYAVVQTCDTYLKAYFNRIIVYMCCLFLYKTYFKLYCLYAHHTWSKLVSIGVFFFFLVTYYCNSKSQYSCIFYFMHSSSCFLIHKACGGLCFLDRCEKQAATVQTQVSGGKENASPTSAGENSAEKSKFVPPMPLHVYISFCFVLFLYLAVQQALDLPQPYILIWQLNGLS